MYKIALPNVPQIGDVHAKNLLQHFGSAEKVFKAKQPDLEKIEGIGTVRAKQIKNYGDFKFAEQEIKFIEKYKITALAIDDEAYPQKLLQCYDSPVVLYYKGNANLNHSKMLAIVGTRKNTDYGKNSCEQIIEELKDQNIIIVSGLAHGIDTIAHKAALKNSLSTIGVLAHGLDRIYPAINAPIAKQMVEQGGLLTDYVSNTNPDKQNFPKRNRIVAGMADALLIVESSKKGGALITAELANGYSREVFALPGRNTDKTSEGCNYLIKYNKAMLVTSAEDILKNMNWAGKKSKPKQRELFIQLTKEEQMIVDCLREKETVHIDEIYFKTQLNSSAVAQALLMLEMQGVISSMPGKMYKMVG